MAEAPVQEQLLPSNATGEGEKQDKIYEGYRRLVETLPQRVDYSYRSTTYQHPDQWYCRMKMMVGALAAADHFKARPTDVVMVTRPKSGTTWLKALLFLTVNRSRHALLLQDGNHPFATSNPHQLVPFLELDLYCNGRIPADLDAAPPPRLYASHLPFQSLPASVKATSGCRLIYLCRNPLDTLVSYYHFVKKVNAGIDPQSFTLDGCVEEFISGYTAYGPFWGHVLGYWNASKAMPQTVLFLKYEEMMKEPEIHLKKLAEFVGCPFTEEEEEEGVVGGILRLSSFDHLRNLEINKSGVVEFGHAVLNANLFFRKGGVGDWKNHLTPEMVKRINDISEQKILNSGLAFQYSS